MPGSDGRDDLIPRITQLIEAFQRIADHHEWIGLTRNPPYEPGTARVFGIGEVERGYYLDEPSDTSRRQLVSTVKELSSQAAQILYHALERYSLYSQVSRDLAEALWSCRTNPEYGWTFWLLEFCSFEYAICPHYAMAAATALGALRRLSEAAKRTAEQCVEAPAVLDNADGHGETESSPTESIEALIDQLPALASASEIARKLGHPEQSKQLGTLLGRFRIVNPDCAFHVDDRRPREPEWLYRKADIAGKLAEWLSRLRNE